MEATSWRRASCDRMSLWVVAELLAGAEYYTPRVLCLALGRLQDLYGCFIEGEMMFSIFIFILMHFKD